MTKLETIQKYFTARENSDLQTMLELFTQDVEIYNVNLPVFVGIEGIKKYNEDFNQRIEKCSFEILEVLEKEDIFMVEWKASLTYRKGVIIGEIVVETPFTFELRGINRFDFNGERIENIRIYHETTTVKNLLELHGRKL